MMNNMRCNERKRGISLCKGFIAGALLGIFLILTFLLLSWSFSGPQVRAANTITRVGDVDIIISEQDGSRKNQTIISIATELICEGKFDFAAELLKSSNQTDDSDVQKLLNITKEYEKLEKLRQENRLKAYQDKLEELQQLWVAQSVSDSGGAVDVHIEDPENEQVIVSENIEDPNIDKIVKVLSIIADISEFANDEQRQELLADKFVKSTIAKAIEFATEYESKGKWIESYTGCYYWLKMIDPNNAGYSKYADELVDKVTIAASFQDNPCETRSQRFEGVRPNMISDAIQTLDRQYVNNIDYSQMMKEGIKRCKLLAEVLTLVFANGNEPNEPILSFDQPSSEQINAWNAALDALLSEINTASLIYEGGFGLEKFLVTFDKILDLNTITVNLPEPALVTQFAEAALAALDPYTTIVWPRQVQDFEKIMTNEFTGIGIEISKPQGLLTVGSLLPDTPAYKAGLDAGDVIEKVDGIETKSMSLTCAVKKITGPQGTKVTLAIRSPNEDKARNVVITRDRIIVPTIRGWQRTESGKWLYMIDEQEKIGYIRITSFSAETITDLENVICMLEDEGMKGLIIDLRNNSGGLLDSAVDAVDLFIDDGLIVRTQPRMNMIPSFERAHERGTHPDYPLVIIINSSSASASEIVAGALADDSYNRAVLVGQRTHGKGSVQGIKTFSRWESEMKYTIAYYHLPSGQRVMSKEEAQKKGLDTWGVDPDIKIVLRSDERNHMEETQRDNDVLVQADGAGERELKKHTLEETLLSDPQFAVAMLAVKAKIIEDDNMSTEVD